MTKKIVKVIPNDRVFSITWMIGRRCNYDCMYCPAEYHDKTSEHLSLDKLKDAWNKIYEKTSYKNLPYKISFSGGEPTANKSFLPFVEWLNANFPIHSLLITTNGSAGLNYYKKLCKEISALSFSTHTEFIDEEKFFEKSIELNKLMIRPKKSFHINIMDEYWAKDRIKVYKNFCDKNKISYSVNVIDYSRGTRKDIKNEGKLNLIS